MKFIINTLILLETLRMASSVASKSMNRPILTTVHIVADESTQTVTFEATDGAKAVRRVVSSTVEESGYGIIEVGKHVLAVLAMNGKLAYTTKTRIYEDDDAIKAEIDGNIIVLMRYRINTYGKDSYPPLTHAFNFSPAEAKPKLHIGELINNLKALKATGAEYVELDIHETNDSKIRLIPYDVVLKTQGIEMIMITSNRQWRHL